MNMPIEPAKVRASNPTSWFFGFGAALLMALSPVTVHAQPEATPVEATPAEAAPTETPAEAAPTETPAETTPAEATPAETTPTEEPPPAEPVAVEAPASTEPAAPTTEPAPVEGPKPPAEEPKPTGKLKAQRSAGVGVMATGGAMALGGIALTLAFTVIGDKAQNAEDPVLADIEQADKNARIGGILVASGIAVVAIGGIVFANAVKKGRMGATARVQVTPLGLRF